MSEAEAPQGSIGRIATFLLSLDQEVAASVLRHLDPELVTEVAETMTRLDAEATGPENVDEAWLELARVINGKPRVRPPGQAELHALLERTFDAARADEVLGAIHERRVQERPFAEIEEESPEALAKVLSEESPAVCAVVLAHVDPSVSAVVLSGLGEERALDVVQRMASLKPPTFEMLRALASNLQNRLRSVGTDPVLADSGRRLKTIAEVLNFTTPDVEQSVLDGISKADEETAQEIREYMFSWENLSDIDKRSMQKILGSVDTKTLAVALKGSSPAVEQNVLANLSSRVRDMVSEERELAGPMPLVEVNLCRESIMKAVRDLIDSGEFSPARAGEELVS